LRLRLRELAGSRTRYGYRRLTVMLRREGWKVNAKRVYRLYRDNVVVPKDAPFGATVALTVQVGNATSQSRLTIALSELVRSEFADDPDQ
jgi:transposase InsO family protein